jgi:hypothetical protein
MTAERHPEPWERQDGESARAYDLFRRYRDLPPRERSLARLVSDVGGAAKGRRRGDVERLSARHEWVRRAGAWDDELDRRRRDEQADEVAATARRHAELSRALITAIAQPAIKFLQRLDQDPRRLDELTDKELLHLTVAAGRVMPAVAQLERYVRSGHSAAGAQRTDVAAPTWTPPQDYMLSEDYMIELYAAMAELGWVPRPPDEGGQDDPRDPRGE